MNCQRWIHGSIPIEYFNRDRVTYVYVFSLMYKSIERGQTMLPVPKIDIRDV